MKKIAITAFILFLFSCSSVDTEVEKEMLQLTTEELSEFDGQNGNESYIAVDGTIYDVTNSIEFLSFNLESGKDLSEEIKQISSWEEFIQSLEIVGTLLPDLSIRYEITFLGKNGEVVNKEVYDNLDSLTYPLTKMYGGYRFIKWGEPVEISAEVLDTYILQKLNVSSEYEKIYMTLEELSQYDGKDGKDAYICYEGVIYDVTNNSSWPNGVHRGFINAGQDVTELFKNSGAPHSSANITNLPVVAFLSEE